ncbi:plant UBX domain-containing protein 2 [Panicum miliaceum]|uniref:Plant UBX domain-containing protein 2 n=1 Tax=Panicum miliaceum TaxID=4540 RepID=A0A3L6RM02_PANMI|nr:plant UBX domain-containing protein 2 [Panicum miliaceum]
MGSWGRVRGDLQGKGAASAALASGEAAPAGDEEQLTLSGDEKDLFAELWLEPRSDKFRWVRLGNPRIKEAVADREGVVELLEAVGFRFGHESGELFMVMYEVPGDTRLSGSRRAVLEREDHSAPCLGGG